MSRYNLPIVKMTKKIYEELEQSVSFDVLVEIPTEGDWNVSYGYDHACYWFIQWFPADDEARDVLKEKGLDKDECINLDTFFDGLNHADFASILNAYDARKIHIDYAWMDLAF